METCEAAAPPPFCQAVRGDRTQGWTAQSRSEVMARRGMVATSQPLAAQIGLQVLREGGNAIDAAVATAAALSVTEPMQVGFAGDMFAIIYSARDKKLHVLNASGTAPTGATLERMNALGYRADPQMPGPMSGMPNWGITTVTVPGAAWGWHELLERHGTRTLAQVLAPAIQLARDGFPVSERIAHDWKIPNAYGPDPAKPQKCCTQPDPASVKTWLIDGKPPRAGQLFRNPDLALALELLGKHGRDAFYKGEIAKAIVAKSTAAGGTMTMADLARYRGEWVEPATINYRGYDIFETPPPSQAWAALEALKILEVCTPAWTSGRSIAELGPADPKFYHLALEAKKLAYADLHALNGDPNFVDIPLARLLSKEYAASLCGKVDPQKASTQLAGAPSKPGDTIVLSTADRWGNMVSWVNSNTYAFGSGLTVDGYGFVLHNRGWLFSLEPGSPNVIEPHKRPFNTLTAAFVMKNGKPLLSLTMMGGYMQAQGHMQALINLVDFGANVQAAGDMARWFHDQVSNTVYLEPQLAAVVGPQLSAMGHRLTTTPTSIGGYQAIMFTADANVEEKKRDDAGGFFRAGSDHRKDGQAVGW